MSTGVKGSAAHEEAAKAVPEPFRTVRGWSPAPAAQSLLLPRGYPVVGTDGEEFSSAGTGICICIASARQGKTLGLALPLLEWALLAAEERGVAFVGMPAAFMDALPSSFKGRAVLTPMDELTHLRDRIVLIDDTAVHLNCRDSGSAQTGNRMLNRLAPVISHLGITLVLCVQSMAGIDVSLMRFCMMAPLVKRIDPMALNHERSEWARELREAQYPLRQGGYDRSLYWSVADSLLCRAPWPEWCRPGDTPEQFERHDALSRPFRFLEQSALDAMVNARPLPAPDHRPPDAAFSGPEASE